MRAPSTGRVLLVCASVIALLVTGGLGGPPPPTMAAASAHVESAWKASVGTGGGNGSATVRAFDTARGSVILSLRRLTPSARYAVVIRRGACGSLGTQVTAVGTFTATRSGALSGTAPLTTAQVAAVRNAAVGTSRVSLVAGTGTGARCGTLVKSLDVTPQIWFGPLPVTTRGWVVDGATDYAALFDKNAPWPQVAGRTHVFIFNEWWLDGYVSTAELRRMIDALKARQIRIAIDWYALQPANGCGVDVNGFGTGADGLLRDLRQIRSLGGTVDYVSINEPFSGGVLWDGPNACHWSVERVAQKVAAQVARVRAEFPGIRFGLIEGYNGPPWIDFVTEWISAYEAAVGERLPFLHLDTDYTAPGCAPARSRHTASAGARGSASTTPRGRPPRPTPSGSPAQARASGRSSSREPDRPTMPSSGCGRTSPITSSRRPARRR